MSLHTGEIDAAWDKLGMVIRNTGDRHAQFRYADKLVLTTKRSFGRGVIEGPVQYRLRQQLKLNEDQFKELIACPLGRPEYVEILRAKGLLPKEEERKPPEKKGKDKNDQQSRRKRS